MPVGVSPKLSRLDIECPCTGPVEGAWGSNAHDDAQVQLPAMGTDRTQTAAARLLLQLAGPRLRELRMTFRHDFWPPPAPHPLLYCTALTKLDLESNTEDQGGDMLRAISLLTSLRDLSVNEEDQTEFDSTARIERAGSLEFCLSPLTALTRLDIGLRCLQHWQRRDRGLLGRLRLEEMLCQPEYAQHPQAAAQLLAAVASEWRALAAAARCMPRLRELSTPAQADAADLASLTALTSLHVGAIALPSPGPDAAAAVAQGASPPPMYDLPPLLQRLTLNMPLPTRIAAALRQAPSATLACAPKIILQVIPWRTEPLWALRFGNQDLDPQGRLTADAVETLRAAVSSLGASFGFGSDERSAERSIQVEMISDRWFPAGVQPPQLGGAVATHCGTWLRALVELQPLSLRLDSFNLAPWDMLDMAGCFARLEELELRDCGYELASLSLLSGLPALQSLVVESNNWLWVYTWDQDPPRRRIEARAVEAAFLGLVTAPARAASGAWAPSCLRRVRVLCESPDDVEWLEDALGYVIEWAEQRLPQPLELAVVKGGDE